MNFLLLFIYRGLYYIINFMDLKLHLRLLSKTIKKKTQKQTREIHI